MDDEGGVLGNLPRSRPGVRSEKRGSAARAAERAERQSAKAARPTGQAAGAPEPGPEAEASRKPEGGPDPVGDALRLGAGVAGLGLRMANGLTREVLRRLPRP